MLRWSLWSVEHRAKLSPPQRRRVLVKWLLAGGIVTTIQVVILAALMLLVVGAGLAILIESAAFAWVRASMVGFIAAVDVLVFHQIIICYIASELAETLERQGLLRGPPVCPRCGYDLRGKPGGACPECGHTRPNATD